ncbi:MAG: hypothetical protein U5K55_15425 [Aliarcobacter sp.]|nr:hypothetical protein [Aliarcobacter sp.]
MKWQKKRLNHQISFSSIEDIFKGMEEYIQNLVSFSTPLHHMGYFLLLAEISNNKDFKIINFKNRASSFLRSYSNLNIKYHSMTNLPMNNAVQK